MTRALYDKAQVVALRKGHRGRNVAFTPGINGEGGLDSGQIELTKGARVQVPAGEGGQPEFVVRGGESGRA
jgi:hypothetical protein